MSPDLERVTLCLCAHYWRTDSARMRERHHWRGRRTPRLTWWHNRNIRVRFLSRSWKTPLANPSSPSKKPPKGTLSALSSRERASRRGCRWVRRRRWRLAPRTKTSYRTMQANSLPKSFQKGSQIKYVYPIEEWSRKLMPKYWVPVHRYFRLPREWDLWLLRMNQSILQQRFAPKSLRAPKTYSDLLLPNQIYQASKNHQRYQLFRKLLR